MNGGVSKKTGNPDETNMPRRNQLPIFFLLVATFFLRTPEGVSGVERRMESEFERCCALGTDWASQGLRCEKFVGPVNGVPRVEQSLCLEAVDICCVRAYQEKSCDRGKDNARAGLACAHSNEKSKDSSCPAEQQRDCCEGCKLGILTGSMGQGCAFKSFGFGKPWDPAFLECCHEASPSTSGTSGSPFETTEAAKSSNIGRSLTEATGASTTEDRSDFTLDSTLPTIPTPGLDDICQLMKGLLCSDICVPTPGSFYCECPEDSVLLEDGKTCRKNLPEDRCKTSNPCSQRCTDTGAEIKCACNPGFILGEDKHSCSAISARLGGPTEQTNELEPRCPAGFEFNKTAHVCDDIDECEENPCPEVCHNVVGSFVCSPNSISDNSAYGSRNEESCPPGYRWESILHHCIDIDECLELNEACNDDFHLCVNTQGSFSCHELNGPKACPAGFKFDVSAEICRDVDECAEGIHNCLPEVQQCRNMVGAYECDVNCDKGFYYSSRHGACLDIDECTESLHPCPDPMTRCVNNRGSYECKRIEKKLETDDVLRATESEISTDGCTDKGGKYLCGDRVRDYDSFDAVRKNGEIPREGNPMKVPEVFSRDSERIVVSDDKYMGSVVTDDSSRTNCPLGAFYDSALKTCRCLAGYQIDPVNGECRERSENATGDQMSLHSTETEAILGHCPPGYKDDNNVCRDINECADGPGCQMGETCENLAGGYECSPRCNRGWEYDQSTGSCVDIDECEQDRHDCPKETHRCFNANGTFFCNETEICGNGYRRAENGSCLDIDECAEGPGCGDHEVCKNLAGRYDCSPLCIKGWRFDRSSKSCVDIDECVLGRHNCTQSQRCVNANGTYHCQMIPPCTSGFRKMFNGSCVDIDECLENLHDCPLHYHRYCVNREGTYECVTRYPDCPKGYEYSLRTRNCQDIDECSRGDFQCDSSFGERCVNLPGSYRCQGPPMTVHGKRPACPTGYRYDPGMRRCTDVDECTEGLHSCGKEVCYNQPGGYSCGRAPSPVTPVETTAVTLGAGSNCGAGTRPAKGRGCTDIDECHEDPEICTSNEKCINTPGSYSCECKTGFRRDDLTQACVDINECQLPENDCLSTQRCDNTLGSYTCVRHLPCGTGYTLNAATEICEDDDECTLGTHDCSGGYHCRNTLGSYRCDRNPRGPTNFGSKIQPSSRPKTLATTTSSTTTTTTTTTTPLPIFAPRSQGICPEGFRDGPNGQCIDIDECRGPNPCARSLQKCINTLGSYKCVSRVLCGNGYSLDPETGSRCIDIDECANGSHECTPGQTCQNRQGGYVCACPPGHAVGPNRDCVDIDECSVYGAQSYGGLCGQNSRCENTVGSYRCICEPGFENVAVGNGAGFCQDIDECVKSAGICQHDCFNAWGSYRCSCRQGFRLNPDNRTCTDVDECVEFKQNNLCIGMCENTPGSYSCSCPTGYKLGVDQRTCQDIDECASGRVCLDPNEMCQNTRGGFRCNRIDCPTGYYQDRDRKNRCVRTSRYCPSGDLACFRAPSHFSYNFITFVSMLPIPSSGILELFTMRGTHLPGSTVQFTMALVAAHAPPGVTRATESCFALKRPSPSQAVLVLTRPIPGPQEIELDLTMEIYHNTAFAGSVVAKLFIFVSQYEF